MDIQTLIFTPSYFYKYATCPHWLWHDAFGDQSKKGDLPALTEKPSSRVYYEEAVKTGLMQSKLL